MSEQTARTAGLLQGRTVLITGVLRPASIAAAIAVVAREQGARVVLTGHPRTLALTRATARRIGDAHAVLPLDAADAASRAALLPRLAREGVERLDGVVHAIAHADPALLGTLLPAGADTDAAAGVDADAHSRVLAEAFTASAASLPALVDAVRSLLTPRASVVALTFDTGHVHLGYGWMGPLKAALEASVRGLAVELGPAGVRVNAVSAGPLVTPAASAIPGLEALASRWEAAAPLGWDRHDAAAVARTAVALLSDWLPATTGQVIHADGGAALCLR
ncbi:Enoyl-[acyl-carrier-protein] reductase [NADH] [Actinomyces ruminicola]|uniref:Enoyl-[acyl-carrier-protein] reductase [NADH] n=1 Tax=Actinomyces ruminicola TaxID=332524 RepID=A0A1H0DVY3_9ACTO|nr:SDR family oxidoreductase [Actinomyces ruminicola]SDN74427.1 Enoyl-[acyl-carrier-protein] reductase [NADH] [Actinomyces ruminicola]